ncbi:Alpha/Beta hydrolase protein [Rhexocercosporidium sp. MPI-PUGE-AT-0058]|nr:Alpha/Beta hydrolase protein [Rhexocercosporidium sp. MPI-PUGE-AT-0058]
MAILTVLLTILSVSPLLHASIIPSQNQAHLSPPNPSTSASTSSDDTPLPLIIWHGLGDNYAADGLADVAALAEKVHPGTFTYIIRLDEDASSDRTATFFGNLTLQLEQVCADLASHPILSTAPAVDALGFSQGGQFLRGYIERCNKPPQHNGISEFQTCSSGDWVCKGAQGLLRSNTWSSFVQSRLVPAQYFRDPAQLDDYLEHSNFLADVNNERQLKNQTYKENLGRLERFTMVLFEEDETVVPKESSWWAEVDEEGNVTELRERDIYKEDWVGLRGLDEKGALRFETTEGGHMQLGSKVLKKTFRENFGRMGRSFDEGKVEEGILEEGEGGEEWRLEL